MNSLFINETALHTRLLRPPSPSLLQAGSRVGGLGRGALPLFAASLEESGSS